MITRRNLIIGATAALAAPRVESARAESTGSWRLVAGPGAPGARWDHTLSADDAGKQLIVAFGRDAAGAALGDCWIAERSTGEWEPIEASGPSPRFGHAVASDPENGSIYLYGGQSADQFFSDLWLLDPAARRWEQLSDGATGPAPRYGTSLVFDGNGTLFVSHGFTFEGRFDDTWAFDLSDGAWSDRSPDPANRPLKRCLHEAVWNSATDSMWFYGGCSSGFGPCPQGDLWSFDPVAGVWVEEAISGPAARSNPALDYDRHQDRMVLTGGLTESGATNDLWLGSFDGGAGSWAEVPVEGDTPSPRSSHDAVMSGGALYLFGGTGPDGVLGDLWRLKIAEPA